MHNKASLALGVGVMLVAAYAIVQAWAWPAKAALFPLSIALPLFFLAAAELAWVLLGHPEPQGEAKDLQLAASDERVRRTLVGIGWIVGFFAAIVLLGFPIAIPLFVLLYLRLQGGESWTVSIVTAGAVWALFYGLFSELLHLPFPAGWLFAWL